MEQKYGGSMMSMETASILEDQMDTNGQQPMTIEEMNYLLEILMVLYSLGNMTNEIE